MCARKHGTRRLGQQMQATPSTRLWRSPLHTSAIALSYPLALLQQNLSMPWRPQEPEIQARNVYQHLQLIFQAALSKQWLRWKWMDRGKSSEMPPMDRPVHAALVLHAAIALFRNLLLHTVDQILRRDWSSAQVIHLLSTTDSKKMSAMSSVEYTPCRILHMQTAKLHSLSLLSFHMSAATASLR